MQAIRFSRFGPAHEVAELVDVPEPDAPGPGEVLIEIERSSIEPEVFDAGIRALHRTTEPDGVFCYTFFKGVATHGRRKGDG